MAEETTTQEEIPGQQSLLDEEAARESLVDQIAKDIRVQMAENGNNDVTEDEPKEGESTDDGEGATEDDGEELEEGAEESTDDTPVPEAQTIKIGNRELDAKTAADAVEIYDWSQIPQVKDALNALTSGKFQLVPIDEEAPKNEAITEDEYIDPRAAKDISDLRARIETFETAQSQERMAWFRNETEKGSIAFQTAHQLSAEEIASLETQLQQSNILPGIAAGIVQRTGTPDPAAAVQEGLKMIYAIDPNFQQKELDRLITKERETEAQTKERKRKASKLSGKGGSVIREPATSTKGMTLADKTTAIAAELRESGAFPGQ